MMDGVDSLFGFLSYNTALFDQGTIQRMACHFQQLLAAIVADPQQRLHTLPLLTEVERQQLLVEWNPTQAMYATDSKIAQLFESQVARTPEAVAVVCDEDRLTYRDLNERANQLAHHLQAIGVHPEVPVGFYVERSAEMGIGLLGILKAGGVYVPLGPDDPVERLAFVLQDARIQVVVTREHMVSQLPQNETRVVCPDGAEVARYPTYNPARRMAPDRLAYIIYTSGSTGQPKGVMVDHRALAHHCQIIQDRYHLTSRDRVLQFASLNFDVSLEQFLPPLLAGACVVIGDLWSPAEFRQNLRDFALTVVDLPPAYCEQVLEACMDVSMLEQENALRLLIVGGEAAPVTLVSKWQQTPLKSARLLNAYGPTEATITATVFDVPSELDSERSRACLPIGRPLANRLVYILDNHLQPAPMGVPGELHIGGAGLARGYWNRPELTESTFIPNPFGDGRLYKTGDLARYLPDGTIEFLGRLDHQVKLRGFRIELGEIEAVLRQHPGVADCVVVVRAESSGHQQLAAYIIPENAASTRSPVYRVSASDLREYLQPKLAVYMVPAAFVILDHFPLTPHGTVDRHALPAPERSGADASYEPPRTPIEEAVSAIWAEVFGLEWVGRHDNFFALGGHSLLATKILSRLGDIFRMTLAVRVLFEHTTVAALAAYVASVDMMRDREPLDRDSDEEIERW